MRDLYWQLITWIDSNEGFIAALVTASTILFVLTLLLVPWLAIRIPSDYFSNPNRYRSALSEQHPLLMIIFKLIRNLVALCLMAIGTILLVLPGQGLLTIFLGVVVADFPGKRQLVNWLVYKDNVCRTINWLRRRAGKEEIELPKKNL